ncbi:MAG: hypothetical protein QM648_02905 [Solirubrobacterales bacterium]
MQLNSEFRFQGHESALADFADSVETIMVCRYLSQTRNLQVGSFLRGTEWIGAVRVSLS